jgi:hypothetical protein
MNKYHLKEVILFGAVISIVLGIGSIALSSIWNEELCGTVSYLSFFIMVALIISYMALGFDEKEEPSGPYEDPEESAATAEANASTDRSPRP